MKQIKTFLMVIAVLLLAVTVGFNAQNAYADEVKVWDGKTVTQPTVIRSVEGVYYYEISTAEELAYLAQASGEWLEYNYILVNDIVLNEVALTYDAMGNITVDTSSLNKWKAISGLKGILDGNGFNICGLYMDSAENASFICNLGTDVRNISIKNAYVRSTAGSAAGICIGLNSHTVYGCTFEGAVVGVDYVGGIVSSVAGSVEKSVNNGDVFGKGNYVGGIAGYITHWDITECVNNGNVFSTGNYVGGIAGGCSELYNPSKCDNYGSVIGKDYVGGICGLGAGDSWTSGNNYGDIAGEKYVGGLIGFSDNDSNRGSIVGNNSGSVTGIEYVGGIVGWMRFITLSNCHNSGNVVGTTMVGGLAGFSDSIWGRGAVENCSFDKNDTINTNLTEFGNVAGEEGITPPAQEGPWDGSAKEPTVLVNVDGVYYYMIYNASELAFLSNLSGEWVDYNYMLANDIILNEVALTYDAMGNITVDTSSLNKWKAISGLNGILDGNGFTIYGLYMDSAENVAFICNLGTDVKNISIKNAYVRSTAGSAAGICIGLNSHTIYGCTFEGAVVGVDYVGGIVSSVTGSVEKSVNNGDVFGKGNYVGGIAGYITHWDITECVNNGNVFSTGNYVGGIAGGCSELYNPSKCDNYGNVTGKDYVGGVCGLGAGDSWTSGNNYGDIAGEKYVGGLIGFSDNDSNRGSIVGNNSGCVTGVEYVGGIVGWMRFIRLEGNINLGNVSGNTMVGGIAGYSESIWGRGEVKDCSYLKTDSINTNLYAFGNVSEAVDGTIVIEDASGLCIDANGKIHANGHVYDNSNECDADCDNCGFIREVEHTYEVVRNDDTTHWYICRCGAKDESSVVPHDTEYEYCSVCAYYIGSNNSSDDTIDVTPVQHTAKTKWRKNKNYHWHDCADCEEHVYDKASHEDTDGDKECDVCGRDLSIGEDNDSLEAGAVVGIVAGCIGGAVVLGAGGFAVVWFVLKKKSVADLMALISKFKK